MWKEGTWNVLKEMEDPYLKELARADSTVTKYLGAFKRWKTALAAKALYLQHLGDNLHSRAAVEEGCNALAWEYAMARLPYHHS